MLLDEAYRQYSNGMVRAMTSFCGDMHAAQDAVSHAFAQGAANILMLQNMPPPAMKAWLYAAARNAAIDIKRREARFAPLPQEDLTPDPTPDPTDRLVTEQMLNTLPPALKEPVILKYYQGLNASQIGAVMHLPPATVRTRLRTALKLMRATMKGE